MVSFYPRVLSINVFDTSVIAQKYSNYWFYSLQNPNPILESKAIELIPMDHEHGI